MKPSVDREAEYIQCPYCGRALLPEETLCACVAVPPPHYPTPQWPDAGNVERLLDEEAHKEKGGFGDIGEQNGQDF